MLQEFANQIKLNFFYRAGSISGENLNGKKNGKKNTQ
jgi:hypothetical protein